MSEEATTCTVTCGPVTLTLHQKPFSLCHGTTVWDAGIILARYFAEQPSKFNPTRLRGTRAIDLGSGTGVAGLGLAACGASVVLTDLPEVVPTLEANMARNMPHVREVMELPDGTVSVQPFTWGHDDASKLEPPFDYILGADVVYSESLVPVLLDTIASLAGPRTSIVLANEFRCSLVSAAFNEHAKKLFRVKRVPGKKLPAGFEGCNLLVYELRLKPGK